MGRLGTLQDIHFIWARRSEWIKTRSLTGQNFDSHLGIEV